MFENLFEYIERHLQNVCFESVGGKVEMLIVAVSKTCLYSKKLKLQQMHDFNRILCVLSLDCFWIGKQNMILILYSCC